MTQFISSHCNQIGLSLILSVKSDYKLRVGRFIGFISQSPSVVVVAVGDTRFGTSNATAALLYFVEL